ncbi:copper homeostasis protein CutC [Paractinoplanes globisporus]|uniref:PF03932 family protein CutC n=1 Tax=Paractinoplanes globisporus TaxID=113565 RepID=A0ABW6W5Y9_9ACTN|nr:copper homeostasis protein CutC [Actinoplanes globisporus]
MGMVEFELAVQDTHGLAVAAKIKPDRIELCSALQLGGLTPSLGLIETAVATPGIPPVHVLIRPRAGGFAYAADDTALIMRDIVNVLKAGACGLVMGGIQGGKVDKSLMEGAVEAAGDAEVTFHRAFDTVHDPEEAVETLAGLGVRRILADATDLETLARAVEAAAGRIEIMAGGGVRPHLVEKIVRTGVDAVHASAKHTVRDAVGITLGSSAPAGEQGRETTDEHEAARIMSALRAAAARR